MRIWKWTLILTGEQTIEIPLAAEILTVQMQGDNPQLWALCDEHAHKSVRHIAIYGTGQPMPENPGKYIATFQLHNGALVFHAFEIYGH